MDGEVSVRVMGAWGGCLLTLQGEVATLTEAQPLRHPLRFLGEQLWPQGERWIWSMRGDGGLRRITWASVLVRCSPISMGFCPVPSTLLFLEYFKHILKK